MSRIYDTEGLNMPRKYQSSFLSPSCSRDDIMPLSISDSRRSKARLTQGSFYFYFVSYNRLVCLEDTPKFPTMNSFPPSPHYTSGQITTYLHYIAHPSPNDIPPPTFSFLKSLITHNLSTIPFDNLKLHYSHHATSSTPPYTHSRAPSLDPEDLYKTIVNTGRGGYCVEMNAFFGHMLRSLGFTVKPRGAKVHMKYCLNEPGEWWAGWSHMVNLVEIEGSDWLVDVGFGGVGPVGPLLADSEEIVRGIGDMDCRVRKWGNRPAEEVEDEGMREQMRVYETRTGGGDWEPVYAFSRHVKFFRQDYEVMNWFVSTNPNSWFTRRLVCMKYLRDEQSKELTGALILEEGIFSKRIGGEKEVLTECKTDKERAEGLERWFGIELNEEEVKGIKKLPSVLGN
ncbi:MAG: N-terminal acetyltransferase [Bogoriella megaspora]|nr:MAG: N-terminal acetyltransferase [Bogoriella megaspora]